MVLSMFVSILFLLCHSAIAVTSSPYSAVTALDKYGNSVQLKNAREAATRYGMPVVAATCTEGVVVVSVHKPRLGILSQPTLIHTLSLHAPPMGIVCTGIKADAKWLVSTMRDYQKRNWESYDLKNLSRKRSQQVSAQALLTFMGYNRDKELHDGLVVDSEETWARPLGVQSMLVSSDGPITLVDPSGTSQHFNAQAIGKNSREVNAKLEERYEPHQSVQEVQQLLVDILKEVFDDAGNDSELVVDILTPDGIERIRIRNQRS